MTLIMKKEDTYFCEKHNAKTTCLCQECNTLMCLECFYTHSKDQKHLGFLMPVNKYVEKRVDYLMSRQTELAKAMKLIIAQRNEVIKLIVDIEGVDQLNAQYKKTIEELKRRFDEERMRREDIAKNLGKYVKEMDKLYVLHEKTRSKEAELIADINKMSKREKCIFTKNELLRAKEEGSLEKLDTYLHNYRVKIKKEIEKQHAGDKALHDSKLEALVTKLTDSLQANLQMQVDMANVTLDYSGKELAKEYERKRQEILSAAEELKRYKNLIINCRDTQERMERTIEEVDREYQRSQNYNISK
eukprot:TRINITY_DN66658_c0_g1_i1.p3 TRINITY_DN66658_c0_g1~~TRINITY_DN66658_c0_g1_i1.p3  ORF type:complete len:302 (-),score=47.72 TRINITY_DN66658_c0_g1_i1:1205-2110(-)